MDTMHSLGLRLDAEEIYSINNNSLKDAIVIFGGGCTGEIVSDEGLLFTNYHCGFDAIQNHSTLERNYLKDGFWAGTRKDELPNENLSVTFLIRIEDVSDMIMSQVSDTLDENDRSLKIAILSDSLSQAAIEGTHYNADVEPLFGGNVYYLFVYEVYRDVRYVGSPPSSIGKFGYDTDNWTWPRHTGDFSVFRVYSGPDGKPARYNENNIPLKPKHFLPVSLADRKIDDFAMVLGYPGTTKRYMTSYEIRELMEITNPNRIKIRGLRLEILKKDMLADDKVNIQYASKYYTSSNYWKYSLGENEGLRKHHVLQRREQEEKEFMQWVEADSQRMTKYGEALDMISDVVDKRGGFKHALQYTYEGFFTAAELFAMANHSIGLYNALSDFTQDKALINALSALLKKRFDDFMLEYNPGTDMKVIPEIMKLYKSNVPSEFIPDIYDHIRVKYKNNYTDFTRDLFEKSIFADRAKFEAFIKNPTREILEKDLVFKTVQSANVIYRKTYYGSYALNSEFERGHRLYIAGLQEKDPDRLFYPDANFTMRLSYGTIQNYEPRDAVLYDYYTTLTGLMEKENPDNPEFLVPQRLKELYEKRDFGEYGNNNEMPVCFITNNDITGGNSGSPVMDGDGNLIGLAFDGNWEALSSSIDFEPAVQRCICVDIRYVLFIIDKFAEASHLIKELKIIR